MSQRFVRGGTAAPSSFPTRGASTGCAASPLRAATCSASVAATDDVAVGVSVEKVSASSSALTRDASVSIAPICALRVSSPPSAERARTLTARARSLEAAPGEGSPGSAATPLAASAEHQAIRGRLSTTDRDRLDTHFDLIRQLEARIAGLSEASCPTAPDRGVLTSEEAEYDALFRSMVDVVAAAFSCDFTRVATLSLGDLPSDDFGWGWYLSGDAHNDFAHRIFQDDESAQAMSDYTAAHAAQLAYLIGLLESIPDPEGGSLMDHTLIAWGSELGDGWHGYDRWCALTAGGGWHLDTGTYRHWEFGGTPIALLTGRGRIERCGLPHQHMLVEPDPGPNGLKSWSGQHIRTLEFEVPISKTLKIVQN